MIKPHIRAKVIRHRIGVVRLKTYLKENSAAELARDLKIPPPLLSQWKTGVRPVPLERCTEIENATAGSVTRRDLRPDDWWKIWPELVTSEFPSPASEAA